MDNPAYLWAQILTVIEYGLLGLSYLAKNRKMVVLLDIGSMALGILVYLLLGADMGMGMSVIILAANFYYLYQEKKYGEQKKLFLRDYVALGIVLAAIAVVAVISYDGWLSLLSVAATVLYEVSIWQKSTKVYKFLGIPVAFCWMTYNGFERSIAGVACELGMFLAAIIGYFKELAEEGERPARVRRPVASARTAGAVPRPVSRVVAGSGSRPRSGSGARKKK